MQFQIMKLSQWNTMSSINWHISVGVTTMAVSFFYEERSKFTKTLKVVEAKTFESCEYINFEEATKPCFLIFVYIFYE